MKQIKFSHDYEKLPTDWEGTHAILIGIGMIDSMENFKNRFPQIVRKDTTFRGEAGAYRFDFEEGILLTFFHLNSGFIFTTIRRYTVGKYDYYENSILETFELVRVQEA